MTDTVFNMSGSIASQATLSKAYDAWLTGEVLSLSENLAFDAHKDGMAVNEAVALRSAIEAGSFTLGDVFTAAQSKTGAIADIAGTPAPKVTVTYLVDGVSKTHTFNLADFMSGQATSTWKDSGKNGQYHSREYLTDVNHDLPADYDANWDNPPPPNLAPVASDFDFGSLSETAANPDGSKASGDFVSVVDLDDLVTDDHDQGALTFAIDSLPAGVTYDADTHQISVDRNSSAFDHLKLGETESFEIAYTATDSGGLSDTGKLSFSIVGTADLYHEEDTFSFAKTDSSEQGRGFTENFAIEEGSNYSGTVTIWGSADLNAKNESLTVTVEGGTGWNTVGADSNSSGTEQLTGYSHDIAVNSVAFTDGNVVISGEFSQQVANGSTINVELNYAYWA